MKKAGYATAHFGKWHMGRVSPSQHGFDENDGANGNGGPDNVAAPNPKQALAMTAKGIDFMERQVKAGEIVTAKTRARLISAIPQAPHGNRVALMDLHVGELLPEGRRGVYGSDSDADG